MKRLAEKFTKHRHQFEQFCRTETTAVYMQQYSAVKLRIAWTRELHPVGEWMRSAIRVIIMVTVLVLLLELVSMRTRSLAEQLR